MNSSINSPDSFSLYTAIPLESTNYSRNDLNGMVFGSFHQNDARFSSSLEDFSAHVMQHACWHTQLALM